MNLRSLALALLACVAAGCAAPPPAPKSPPATLEQIVSEHNARAAAVPKLWANANISVTIPSRPFPWTFSSGVLLLGKEANPLGPVDFTLLAREASQPVFQIGSNIDQNVYYFWVKYGDKGQLWRGRLDLAGAPGVKMPIDPTQLPSILNVLALPSPSPQGATPQQVSQGPLPTVTMTLRNPRPVWSGIFLTGYEPYAYQLTYFDRQPVTGRAIPKREILIRRSDTEPRLPYKIDFLNADGRVVMTASLDKYRPVDMGSESTVSAPTVLVPTDINVVWPEQNSRLHLVLSDMTVTKGEPALASELVPPAGIPQTDVDQSVTPAIAPAAIKGSK